MTKTNQLYNEKTGQWSVPEGARTFTTTRQFQAVQVHNPKDFPGVAIQAVTVPKALVGTPTGKNVLLAGEVLEWRYVLSTSPYGGLWSPIHCGDWVLYPDDPSTNMLRIMSGKDFMHWHKGELTEEEMDRAYYLTEDCE